MPLEISNDKRPRFVSLLTDFGHKDYYVASLKARVLNTPHPMQVIDISHEIETHDIVKAAFFISNCYQDFPDGTIHIVAINNSYVYNPELICFQFNGHFFIGPNNGLFSLEFTGINIDTIRLVTIPDISSDISLNDKIAYATHHILTHGHVKNLGKPLRLFDQKLGIQAVISKQEIRASVIHVDHYDNVIINLKREVFNKYRMDRDFCIYIKPSDPIEQISDSYADVPVGDVLCIFNESDYLTIAINNGKAGSMYSLERNDTIQIMFYGE